MVAVRAVVKAVVRAQPAVRAAVRMFNAANFYSQVSGADGEPRFSERKLGAVNGSVRHHHGNQNCQGAPLTHVVTTASNYCGELGGRDGE